MSGGLTQPAIDLLKRLATHYTKIIDPMRLSPRDTPNALEGRRYSQWLQAISIAGARTIADRLRGASAQAIARVTVPGPNAAALLSHFQRETGSISTSPNSITTDRYLLYSEF
jgi:hypothetical protein